MKEIPIDLLLKNLSNDNIYVDDVWKTCLNVKGKRYNVKDIVKALKKLESLGLIKKNKNSKTDTHYNKVSYSNLEDYIGFINNIIFENESKIKKTLKKLENKRIFVDISTNLQSYKIEKKTKEDYENILNARLNMIELLSSIELVRKTSKNKKFRNQITECNHEIKKTLEQTNTTIMKGRKSNEIILLQKYFVEGIPNQGCLKL